MKKNTAKSGLVSLLALLMAVGSITGCNKPATDEDGNVIEEIDKGAEINMYIGDFPYDLDPGRIHYDSDLYKYYSLIYEGLFRIGENGKLEGALVKDWEYEVDERDEKMKLQLKLNSTSWSDGVAVDADDVVYTFKRILSPDTSNPAASLLYPIENARDAKAGLVTIDDVGFSAINSSTIEIIFEKEFTDVDYFLRNLASPVFTPVREDAVTNYGEDWAQPIRFRQLRDPEAFNSIVTNGPFTIKEWVVDDITREPVSMLLERSSYYRNLNVEQDLDTYVRPYRIMINFADGADAQLEKYGLSEGLDRVFLVSSFSNEGYTANSDDMDTFADGSVYSYYFNTNNTLLAKPEVRKALSVALDRNAIAEIAGRGAVPATGYVPTGIDADNKGKNEYRDAAGDVISAQASIDEAKTLLNNAKVSSGSLTIAVRKGVEWEMAVAEAAKASWKQLGISVTIKEVDAKSTKTDVISPYEKMLATGDFDVIALDICALSSDAYYFLVPYAAQYSGSVIPIDEDVVSEFPYVAHVTGFDDDEYNALIGEFVYDPETNESSIESGILCAKDAKERLAIYIEAEKMLAEKVPSAPLFFGSNSYLVSGSLSKVKYNSLGAPLLTGAKLKNYDEYKVSEQDINISTQEVPADE